MCIEYNECHYGGMYNVYVKEFLLLQKLCETLENSNFLKNGKIVISVKTRNISISRMMKRISPLESSRKSS